MFWLPQFRQPYTIVFAIIYQDHHTSLILNHDLNFYGNDITELKSAEEKLRESEEHLRLASRAARACTWELNIQDQSYKLGDNFAEVIGFSADILPKNSNAVSD